MSSLSTNVNARVFTAALGYIFGNGINLLNSNNNIINDEVKSGVENATIEVSTENYQKPIPSDINKEKETENYVSTLTNTTKTVVEQATATLDSVTSDLAPVEFDQFYDANKEKFGNETKESVFQKVKQSIKNKIKEFAGDGPEIRRMFEKIFVEGEGIQSISEFVKATLIDYISLDPISGVSASAALIGAILMLKKSNRKPESTSPIGNQKPESTSPIGNQKPRFIQKTNESFDAAQLLSLLNYKPLRKLNRKSTRRIKSRLIKNKGRSRSKSKSKSKMSKKKGRNSRKKSRRSGISSTNFTW
jgi:hypothetical protein